MEVTNLNIPQKDYRLLNKIQEGNSSYIYECENLITERRVAIKIPKINESIIDQDKIDLVMTGIINDFILEYIDIIPVRLIDYSQLVEELINLNYDGDAIVMELANSMCKIIVILLYLALENEIRNKNIINYNKKIQVCCEMTGALYGLHYLNRSHGKFTIENILVNNINSSREMIKVCDVSFGSLTNSLRLRDNLFLCYNYIAIFDLEFKFDLELNILENLEIFKFLLYENLLVNLSVPSKIKEFLSDLINEKEISILPLLVYIVSENERLNNIIVFPMNNAYNFSYELVYFTPNEKIGCIGYSNDILDKSFSALEFVDDSGNKENFNSEFKIENYSERFFDSRIKMIQLVSSEVFSCNKIQGIKITTEEEKQILIGNVPENGIVLETISDNFYSINGVSIRFDKNKIIQSFIFYLKIENEKFENKLSLESL